MSGIAGILSSFSALVYKERLQQMSGNIIDSSTWIDEEHNTGFVFSTESSASQYLHYHIVFDGHIYNDNVLQATLENLGYNFPTKNNESLIAAAFDYWKEKSMGQIDGAFAFAIHNTQTGEVFLVRDRLGERPLFYYAEFRERGRFSQFMFASKMQSLWCIGAPKNIDATMMLNYIALEYTRNPNKKMATFFSDILSLPPGHYLKIIPKEGRAQMRNWYRPSWKTQEHINDAHAIEQFNTLLENATKTRIPSSNIIGILDKNDINNIAIHTIVQQQTSVSIQAINASIYLDWDDMESFFAIQEEPIANPVFFQEYLIAKQAAQQGICTILDSLGAIESLGGSSDYIGYFLQYLLRKNYSQFKKEKRLFQQNGVLDDWKLSNYIAAFTPEKRAKSAQNSLIKSQSKFPFLNEQFLLRYQNEDILRQPEIDKPEDAMYFDLFTLGIEEKLKTKGKIATHFSQTIHFPFLQYQLIEFLFSLPSHFKFRDGRHEWILQKALETKTSKDFTSTAPIQNHSKPNFTFPVEPIQTAKQKLVEANIFTKEILTTKRAPNDSNVYWRMLNAAYCIDNRIP